MGARFEIVVTDSSQAKPRAEQTPRDDNAAQPVAPSQQPAPPSTPVSRPPSDPMAPVATTQRPAAQPVQRQLPQQSGSRDESQQPTPSQSVGSQPSPARPLKPAGNSEADDQKRLSDLQQALSMYGQQFASTVFGGPVVSQMVHIGRMLAPLVGIVRGGLPKPAAPGDRDVPVSDHRRTDTQPVPRHRDRREDTATLPRSSDGAARSLDKLSHSADRASQSIGDDRRKRGPVQQPRPAEERSPVSQPTQSLPQPVSQPQQQAAQPVEITDFDVRPQQASPDSAPVEGGVTDETIAVIQQMMADQDALPTGINQETIDAITALVTAEPDVRPPHLRTDSSVDPMAPLESPPAPDIRPPHLDALEATQNLPSPKGRLPSLDPMAPVSVPRPPGPVVAPSLGAPPVAALPAAVLPPTVGAAGATAASTGLGVAGGAGVAVGAAEGGAVAAAGGLAAIAGPAVVIVGALTVAAVAVKMFGDAVERNVDQLAKYSSTLSVAQAHSEMREMRAQMSAAQRLSPELAKFEDVRSRASEAMSGTMTEVKLAVLRLVEPMLPFLNKAVDFIEFTTASIKFLSESYAATQDFIRMDFKGRDEHNAEAMKAWKEMIDILKGNNKDDPLIDMWGNMLIDNLKDLGGLGGGKIPRRM